MAELFWTRYATRISCESCVGTSDTTGYTKDQAGKNSQEGKHRYWSCRRANSKAGASTGSRCGRLSCGGYIDRARRCLPQEEFQATLDEVYESSPATYTSLKTYLPTGLPTPMPIPISQTTSLPNNKRSAEDSLPPRGSKEQYHSRRNRQREQTNPPVITEAKALTASWETVQEAEDQVRRAKDLI